MAYDEALANEQPNGALLSDACAAALRAFLNAPQRGRHAALQRDEMTPYVALQGEHFV